MKRDPYTLPQSLILAPDHEFETVRAALVELGFKETTAGIRRPGRPPRQASFAMGGGLPTALYTYFAASGLGMLHLATTPPHLRGQIADRLPWITPSRLPEFLRSSDPRKQLFALWAAREDERVELLHDVRTLAAQSTGQINREAETVAAQLDDLAQKQLETIAGTQLIAESALPLIAEFQDREFLQNHLPTEEDCALLFVPEVAGRVADALKRHSWPRRGINALPKGVEDVFVCPAGMLRWPNTVSDKFPRGYRKIAGWLNPSRIWMGWTGELDSGGTIRLDGLVFAQDRWIFFPAPYRLLSPLIPIIDDARTLMPDQAK